MVAKENLPITKEIGKLMNELANLGANLGKKTSK